MRITALGLPHLDALLVSMGFAPVEFRIPADANSQISTASHGENTLETSMQSVAEYANRSSNGGSEPPFSTVVQVRGMSLYGPNRSRMSPFLDVEAVSNWMANKA